MSRLLLALMLSFVFFIGNPAAATIHAADESSEAAVLASYADNIIIPTYTLLSQRLTALRQSITTLRGSQSEGNLQAARAAWRAARQPWEWSESFLFGPATSLGLDPALDTWPISEDDLEAILAGSIPLDSAAIDSLEPDVKGYHNLELILFGPDGTKTASQFTSRELQYAELIAGEMEGIGMTLVQAWTVGVDGEPAFRTVFTTAGSGSAAYSSTGAAIEEVLSGISGILNEVAEEKIGLPLDSRDPGLAESRFSQSSIEDYKDNVNGAVRAYTGAGNTAVTIQSLVRQSDAALDSRISSGFQRTVSALNAIPAPFEQSILNASTSAPARAARNAAADQADAFDTDVFAALTGGAREAEGRSPAEALNNEALAIDDASQSLARGDVSGAVAAYAKFDDAWEDLEDGVRMKSRDRYREIEGGIIEVRAALLKPARPDPAAAATALNHLRQVINTALPELE